MAAGQLVGPIGGDDHHRRVGQRPGEEAQQVPGRVVGPVDVLHRSPPADPPAGVLQQHGRWPRTAAAAGTRPGRQAGEIREQGAQRRRSGTGPFDHLVATVPGRSGPATRRRSARTAGRRRRAVRTVRGSVEPCDREGGRTGRRANASTTVVLPDPASPPTITKRLPSATTSSRISCSRAACVARPDDVTGSRAGRRTGHPDHVHYACHSRLAGRIVLSGPEPVARCGWPSRRVRDGTAWIRCRQFGRPLRGEPDQPIVGGVGEELVMPLLDHDLERVVVHDAHFCLRVALLLVPQGCF